MSFPPRQKSFNMMELMVVIAIIAVLVIGSIQIFINVLAWARNTSDKHTYTVLNDALTRYKTEGGDQSPGLQDLTEGAGVGRILAQMQNPSSWVGMSHQFLDSGATYRGASIGVTGTGPQFHISRYNSYSDGSGSNSNPYPYGEGVGYLANDGHTAYNFGVQSSTGFVAVKDALGGVTVQDGNMGGDSALGSNASITFWSCIGSGPTPSAPSGLITQIDAGVGDYGDLNLTSINIAGLTGIESLDCSGNASIIGTAASLNSLYSSLPTILSGAALNVDDDSDAASGSNTLIAAGKGWSCDAPSPATQSGPNYPGSGGITITNGSAQEYDLYISVSTNAVAYQPQGGSTKVIAVDGALTIPACDSVVIWPVDSQGNASGSITTFQCTDDLVTSMSVSGNSALQYIYCQRNQISSLTGVNGLTDLLSLVCNTNPLASLNASGDTSLQFLDCHSNQLGTLNITGDNAIGTLSDGGNPSLSVIGP